MVRPVSARLAQAVRPRRLPQSHSRLHQRFASSTPSTEEIQKKAQDALASAQKGLGQALETGKRLLGPVGEKVAASLGSEFAVQCISRVMLEACSRVVASNQLARKTFKGLW